MTRATVCLIVGVVLAAAASAHAESVALDAIDRGYYFDRSVPPHEPTLINYVARVAARGDATRNFFVFDLSSVEGTISAAELRLYNPGAKDGRDGFDSPNGSEMYSVFDVTTPIATLRNPPRHGGEAVYEDLGSGILFGSQTVADRDNGSFVTVPLTDAFLAEANAAGGLLAVGGRISNGWVFGYSSAAPPDSTQLVLTVSVPEPSTFVLLGLGALGLLVWRRLR